MNITLEVVVLRPLLTLKLYPPFSCWILFVGAFNISKWVTKVKFMACSRFWGLGDFAVHLIKCNIAT